MVSPKEDAGRIAPFLSTFPREHAAKLIRTIFRISQDEDPAFRRAR